MNEKGGIVSSIEQTLVDDLVIVLSRFLRDSCYLGFLPESFYLKFLPDSCDKIEPSFYMSTMTSLICYHIFITRFKKDTQISEKHVQQNIH